MYRWRHTARQLALAGKQLYREPAEDWGVAPWRLERFGPRRRWVEWQHHAARLLEMFPEDTDIATTAWAELLCVRLWEDDGRPTAALLAVDGWLHEGLQGPAAEHYDVDLAFVPVDELYDRIRARVRALRYPLSVDFESNWPMQVVSALQLPELGSDVGARSRLLTPPTEWKEWEYLPSALVTALRHCDLLEEHAAV
jgi:hypothetical protein